MFEPSIEVRRCRYIWLGIERPFDAFTFAFERTEHGWFQIHAYQFSADLSTVIVETREETWRAHGLDQADTEQSIEFCERLFARYLGGQRLQSNARHLRGSAWLNFNRVSCRRWHDGNVVLIGDAAHTAHFSIGSGTKLAMEDAISLARHVSVTPELPRALGAGGPVTFDDIMQMKRVSDAAISPDGGSVLYVIRGWEPADDVPAHR